MTTSLKPHPGLAFKLLEWPWLSWALLFGAGVIALRPLTPTWNDNPNYSFGWWIPLVSLFLFAERWPARPLRAGVGPVRLAPTLVFLGFVFFLFRLVAETDPDWRPGLWVIVGLYVAALLGWLWIYGGISWLRHFAFPVCFLFLSLPWLFEIEYPLVQGLMRWNAVLVATSLRAIRIAAEPAGNIIQLQNCQLGVEEACSGILSLQASLMMGCLLGEIYRLAVSRRIVLVLVSMGLALLGNYLRTFFLAMMAFYNGPDAVTRWHDTAGYSILIFTGVGSWLTALALGLGKIPQVSAVEMDTGACDDVRQTVVARRLVILVFAAALVAEAGTQIWFGWKERSLVAHPAWVAHMPASDTFQKITLSDVTLTALRCDVAQAGQWRDGQGWNWSVYWFRYDPKPYTRIVLGWHTPDNCLPSIGLIKDGSNPDFTASVNGLQFYVHPQKFLLKDVPVYIFWVVYANRGDLTPETDRGMASFGSKFRSHLQDIRNGFRGVGAETLEVALTGPPSYEAAKAGYLAGLKTIAVPATSPGRL